jgi:hypothetical protein
MMNLFEPNSFNLKENEGLRWAPQTRIKGFIPNTQFKFSLNMIQAGLPGENFISAFSYEPDCQLYYSRPGFGLPVFEEVIDNELRQTIIQSEFIT